LGCTEVTSVATEVGVVASLVGTVVGVFFGVQVGAVGKEKAEASRERSEEMARAAFSMLPPEAAQQLRSEMNQWQRSECRCKGEGEGLEVPEYQRVYKMLGIETAIVADGSLEESGNVMGAREVGTSST